MIVPLLETVGLLLAVGLLPTVTMVGARPVLVFLAPLGGALVAALAAELELAVGGDLLGWFVPLAVAANVAAAVVLGWRWRINNRPLTDPDLIAVPSAGERGRHQWVWAIVTVVVVAAAALWPLQALRAPAIGFDANAIWLLHSLFIYGGHSAMLAPLHNRLYLPSNLDYPPLVPASGALAFVVKGSSDLDLGVAVTSVLGVCGMGVLACGIAEVPGRDPSVRGRLGALAAGAAVCLIGFGIASPFAVTGFADLAWAAPAVAATVYGLVLPRSHRNLAVAWLAATVAALSKNEGLTTALVLFVLVAIRYGSGPAASRWRRWCLTGLVAVVLVLPAASWSVIIRHYGIRSDFFASGGRESVAYRVGPTVDAFGHYLGIAPVAAVVALLGIVFLRQRRRDLGLGAPGWLWGVTVAYLAILFFTYVVGAPDIHWWLSSSANRSTIFAQLALYADLAMWVAVVAAAVPSNAVPNPSELQTPAQQVDRQGILAPGATGSRGTTI